MKPEKPVDFNVIRAQAGEQGKKKGSRQKCQRPQRSQGRTTEERTWKVQTVPLGEQFKRVCMDAAKGRDPRGLTIHQEDHRAD